MQNCKLFVFNAETLNIIQCRSENPASFVLISNEITQELMDHAVFLRLEWYEGNVLCTVPVKFSKFESLKAIFAKSAQIEKHATEQFHFIEVNDFIDVARISENDITDYRIKADGINNRFRNSLTAQIKKILIDETITNQLILKMLMQLDGKLDELLSIKQKEEDDSMIKVRLMCLSGGGICFIINSASAGDIFFIRALSETASGMTFAALARVTNIIPTEKGDICEASFIHIDESTRDGIIHFVFEKDREKLKRKKING